jgi:hypothetical protein
MAPSTCRSGRYGWLETRRVGLLKYRSKLLFTLGLYSGGKWVRYNARLSIKLLIYFRKYPATNVKYSQSSELASMRVSEGFTVIRIKFY